MSQDSARKNAVSQVVPRSPILRSQDIVSDILRVEHHYQPANRESECCLPNCLLSIHLGQPIQLERTIDGRRSREHLAEGDIMITPPYLHRQLFWDTDAEFLLLRFEPKLFTSVLYESVDADRTQIVPQLKICDPLIQYIGLALKAELAIDGLSDRLYAESMAKALAVHLLRHYSTRKREIRTYSGCLPSHKLQQALDYIQAHLEDVSLEAITTELGMSQYHFARLFKQSTGYSPYQYVIKRRIERAQELMMQEQQSIANIAFKVGFASQSQFGRHFKRLTGVTPKQFLKK